MGLVWPVADRPMVGRFLSPLGYDCWVDECLEERQRVLLPKETRAARPLLLWRGGREQSSFSLVSAE